MVLPIKQWSNQDIGISASCPTYKSGYQHLNVSSNMLVKL